MITLDNWRSRMTDDMCLRNFRPRTHEAYLRAVQQFIDHVAGEPEDWSEEDVRGYFLYLHNDKKAAPSTINVAVHGVRFFFIHTLGRDWPVFELLRVHKRRKLPVVLSEAEVRTVLGVIRNPVSRAALTTIYALGLRLSEGLRIESGDIDAERLLVWVRDGKGAKDRGVPLPRPLLERLRHYWKHDRAKSSGAQLFVAASTSAPLHPTTLQKTFVAARRQVRLDKEASVHTLRHSYGTHLLERGVSLRTIQQVLGHKSLRTTSLYLHVTHPSIERLQETLDRMMVGL
jgi:site-specific recombinase XerD